MPGNRHHEHDSEQATEGIRGVPKDYLFMNGGYNVIQKCPFSMEQLQKIKEQSMTDAGNCVVCHRHWTSHVRGTPPMTPSRKADPAVSNGRTAADHFRSTTHLIHVKQAYSKRPKLKVPASIQDVIPHPITPAQHRSHGDFVRPADPPRTAHDHKFTETREYHAVGPGKRDNLKDIFNDARASEDMSRHWATSTHKAHTHQGKSPLDPAFVPSSSIGPVIFYQGYDAPKDTSNNSADKELNYQLPQPRYFPTQEQKEEAKREAAGKFKTQMELRERERLEQEQLLRSHLNTFNKSNQSYDEKWERQFMAHRFSQLTNDQLHALPDQLKSQQQGLQLKGLTAISEDSTAPGAAGPNLAANGLVNGANGRPISTPGIAFNGTSQPQYTNQQLAAAATAAEQNAQKLAAQNTGGNEGNGQEPRNILYFEGGHPMFQPNNGPGSGTNFTAKQILPGVQGMDGLPAFPNYPPGTAEYDAVQQQLQAFYQALFEAGYNPDEIQDMIEQNQQGANEEETMQAQQASNAAHSAAMQVFAANQARQAANSGQGELDELSLAAMQMSQANMKQIENIKTQQAQARLVTGRAQAQADALNRNSGVDQKQGANYPLNNPISPLSGPGPNVVRTPWNTVIPEKQGRAVGDYNTEVFPDGPPSRATSAHSYSKPNVFTFQRAGDPGNQAVAGSPQLLPALGSLANVNPLDSMRENIQGSSRPQTGSVNIISKKKGLSRTNSNPAVNRPKTGVQSSSKSLTPTASQLKNAGTGIKQNVLQIGSSRTPKGLKPSRSLPNVRPENNLKGIGASRPATGQQSKEINEMLAKYKSEYWNPANPNGHDYSRKPLATTYYSAQQTAPRPAVTPVLRGPSRELIQAFSSLGADESLDQPPTPMKLPKGWEVKYDPVRARYYYLDHINKVTTWSLPSGAVKSEEVPKFNPEYRPTIPEPTMASIKAKQVTKQANQAKANKAAASKEAKRGEKQPPTSSSTSSRWNMDRMRGDGVSVVDTEGGKIAASMGMDYGSPQKFDACLAKKKLDALDPANCKQPPVASDFGGFPPQWKAQPRRAIVSQTREQLDKSHSRNLTEIGIVKGKGRKK